VEDCEGVAVKLFDCDGVAEPDGDRVADVDGVAVEDAVAEPDEVPEVDCEGDDVMVIVCE